ncbi:MAG: hypothetical protein J5U17_01100 [Candidatus Methanoperedens sp.]|nr:hypothetical protein [Candidatus Methanoperedens sp.]MCE8424359.1 hypothetical protein [Candidatus Methanoperedens sp.]
MTEILESNKLIELVTEKHRRLLDTYNGEFFELESKLNSIKQQWVGIKKEIESTESKIIVLNEKYHLLYHQAKKQREIIISDAIEKMRAIKAANVQDVVRLSGKIEAFEARLQSSKNIDDEEKIIAELRKLFNDIESAVRKGGSLLTCMPIMDKLNEAKASHMELISIGDDPKKHADSFSDIEGQIKEIEGRHNWLKHRIESHNNALAYWAKPQV